MGDGRIEVVRDEQFIYVSKRRCVRGAICVFWLKMGVFLLIGQGVL